MKITKLFLIITVLLFGYQSHSQSDNKKRNIIKVLSFNILHGANTDGSFNLDVIANVIKKSNPDFVALQEVDDKTKRAKGYDLVTELAWRTKLSGIFGKAMNYDGGGYGEGVLSKYDFLNTRNVALPYTEGNEPRAALETVVILPSGDTIAFVGTHLDHLKNPVDRISQAKKINEVFLKSEYPILLAGDLNAEPASEPIEILEKYWTGSYDKKAPQPTYSSEDPTKKIDYVYFYPKHRWKVLKREVIADIKASDHCAFLVTLELVD